MLLYNTTYQVPLADAHNFVIWVRECYIPQVAADGRLRNPRLLHILSHQEPDSECFSLQWEVESSAALHAWHIAQGARLNAELLKVFNNQVVGFPTLMEDITC